MMVDRWFKGALVALTVLAGMLLALDVGGGIRVAVLIAFVLVCPGLAWAPMLRLGDPGDTVGIGIVLSVTLAAIVGQTMALTRWWSPGTAFLVLAGVTLSGVVVTRDVAVANS